MLICICGATADQHQGKDHAFIEKAPAYDPSTWLRGARFAHEGLTPTTPLYITVEDRLRVVVLTTFGTVEVDVAIRLQRPDGQIIPIFLPLQVNTQNVNQTFDFDLTEGFLLDVAVTTPTGGVFNGRVFVIVSIIRGAGTNARLSRLLLSNYVNSLNVLGWPDGTNLQSTQGAGFIVYGSTGTPAAGTDWTYTFPSYLRAALPSVGAQLITSATPANRIPHLQVLDASSNVIWDVAAPGPQAASLTFRYSGVGGVQPFNNDNSTILPIPSNGNYGQSTSFRVVTTNLQAGDQWQNIKVTYMAWLEQ